MSIITGLFCSYLQSFINVARALESINSLYSHLSSSLCRLLVCLIGIDDMNALCYAAFAAVPVVPEELLWNILR